MDADIIIIGAGMAGSSAAYELAGAGHKVLLLERESHPGYHSTGRSAALFTETYGNATVRALCTASRDFLTTPPEGFTDHKLLSPRGTLFIGRTDQIEALDALYLDTRKLVDSIERHDGAYACKMVPILKPDYVAGSVWEPSAMDIDVHGLQDGYLRGVKARGGKLMTDTEITTLEHTGNSWKVTTSQGAFEAPIVINAGGAWAGVLGKMAGATDIGLVPKQRTAVLFEPPAGQNIAGWPAVIDIGEEFYFKSDAGKILASPADETPMEPYDAQPEELDVAIAIDRVMTAADVNVRRIDHKWAGLRSFVADKSPVAGFDPKVPGFFWLAGQGGYGICMAPALARITVALIGTGKLPADIAGLGVTAAEISAARFA
jgi:D-arginine dehydrogenase